MRLRDDLITKTSLLATALVAGLLGIISVTSSPADEEIAASDLPATFEETMVITAPVDDLVLEMAPARQAYLLGEPVAFTARLTNIADDRFVALDTGVQDLAVQRTASTDPMGLGDIGFLALMDVTAKPLVLEPGESELRTIQVGAGEPFDRPGIHRVTGHWLLGDRTVRVPPFDVLIEAAMPIAAKATRALRPGA